MDHYYLHVFGVRFHLLWPVLGALLSFVLAAVAAAHAIMYKRDTRAAIAWMGVIWLAPLLGTALYVLLGVNRIRRRAVQLRGAQVIPPSSRWLPNARPGEQREPLASHPHLAPLARLMRDVTGLPLAEGNRLEPLLDGDQAYPAMLQAIDEAQSSVGLSTYIFDNDRAGREFIAALARAHRRGVAVRVLIDGIGANYSWPSVVRTLRREGVRTARFMRTLVPVWFAYTNLRNHRKIMVVDGRLGFTGGINIREEHRLSLQPRHPTKDLHFRVEGPVVSHLAAVFADDWSFVTGEPLEGESWFPALAARGGALARGVPVGPDGNFDKLRMTLSGALACSQRSVRIVTPYFLPDAPLINALNVAALRGVRVDIVLPERTNLKLVGWACAALLWQVLERGCRVWLSPPPFDHTKLMVVNGAWTLLGSGNWDPRSLRLNFEFNLECYDSALATALDALIDGKIGAARQLKLQDVDGRKLHIRLRDGLARLFSPYL